MTLIEALAETIEILEAAGAVFALQGDKVVIDCPTDEGREELENAIAFLRAHKGDLASLLHSRGNKQHKGVSLARAAEILGAKEVPEGQAPTGWTPQQWAHRKPLPAGKGLTVRYSLCGKSAENPPNGVGWLDDHDCAGLRPCSHCNGGRKKCTCALCQVAGCCTVCKSSGKVDIHAVPPADDLLPKLAEPCSERERTVQKQQVEGRGW